VILAAHDNRVTVFNERMTPLR
jgi:hypothetical protein